MPGAAPSGRRSGKPRWNTENKQLVALDASLITATAKTKPEGYLFSRFRVQGRMTDSYADAAICPETGAAEFHAGSMSPHRTELLWFHAEGVVASGAKGGYGNIVNIEHAGQDRHCHLAPRRPGWR